MRTLTHTVCPEDAGRTVLFCLKKYFGLAEGAVSRLKWQPGGIVLNGGPVRVTVRVHPGMCWRYRWGTPGPAVPLSRRKCPWTFYMRTRIF